MAAIPRRQVLAQQALASGGSTPDPKASARLYPSSYQKTRQQQATQQQRQQLLQLQHQQQKRQHLVREQRPKKVLDGREDLYLDTLGPTNRLLLSLKSGLPSHVTWALTRLINASYNHLDHLFLDALPGLIDALLSFPRKLVSAVRGEEPERWEPSYWEQEERDWDGMGRAAWEEENDGEEDDEEEEGPIRRTKALPAARFSPSSIQSHARLLQNAISAMLILRNTALLEKNERTIVHHGRAINSLICDLLSLPNVFSRDQGIDSAFTEIEGIDELRVYALDLLETTRHKLHIRKRATVAFDVHGIPTSAPDYAEAGKLASNDLEAAGDAGASVEDRAKAARRAGAGVADSILNLLVYHLHATNDRSILMGALRCLGALASEERHESFFVEVDVPTADGSSSISSPGILRKCLTLLPLTSDSPLLESALDCLYQIVNIGNNVLRIGVSRYTDDVEDASANSAAVVGAPKPLGVGTGRRERILSQGDASSSSSSPDLGSSQAHGSRLNAGAGDARGVIRLLARNLIYNRVVWDRTHQLSLHPLLHSGIPGAVGARRREKEELQKRRVGGDLERAKLCRLQRNEWDEVKDMAEPDRLRAWMKLIYEAKDGGEVTQMDFWSTYRDQFAPYSELGGPPLQPAAEVIRTVSAVFPGAVAMVVPPSRFIIKGVETKDRSHLRKHECRWHGCLAPDVESRSLLISHIKAHCMIAPSGKCNWWHCTYSLPKNVPEEKAGDFLFRHALTHLPEDDEVVKKKEAEVQAKAREEAAKVFQDESERVPLHPVALDSQRGGGGKARILAGPEGPKKRLRNDLPELESSIKKRAAILPRGTVDSPDILVFSVTRTPMDPETGKPTGISNTSCLILRSLARTTATIIHRAGLRERRVEPDAGSGGVRRFHPDERFGLPLPSDGGFAAAGVADVEVDGVGGGGGGGGAGDNGGIGPAEGWMLTAASRLMDALIDVEDEMMAVSSENDILCPIINDILAEIKRNPVESIVTEWAPDEEGHEEGKGYEASPLP